MGIWVSKMMEKVIEMRKKVKSELEYIPRGGMPQNLLRSAYSAMRMHSLGKKAEKEMTPKEVLEKSVEMVKKNYPDFEPSCNKGFFGTKMCKIKG